MQRLYRTWAEGEAKQAKAKRAEYVRRSGSSRVPYRFEKRLGTEAGKLVLYSTWDEAGRAEI